MSTLGLEARRKAGLKFLVLGQTGMFWGYLGVGSACPGRGVSTGVTPSMESGGAVGCCDRKWCGAPNTGDGHFLPTLPQGPLGSLPGGFRLLKGCLEGRDAAFES